MEPERTKASNAGEGGGAGGSNISASKRSLRAAKLYGGRKEGYGRQNSIYVVKWLYDGGKILLATCCY